MANNANVRVMVSAITEAAEQAIQDVGQNLTGLADDSMVAQSGLDQVSDELGETATRAAIFAAAMDEASSEMREGALAAALVGNRVDEASDEMAAGAVAASLLSGAYTRLSFSAGTLTLSMGALSTALTVSLIPAILTLSTILAPLGAALIATAGAAGSLVGAFGLLAGVGVLTHMQELQAAFKSVRGEIMELLQPLGEVFGPLLVDAVEALPTLISRILDAVGPIQVFADTLREFGSMAMEVLPAVIGGMFDLARTALPVFKDLVGFLRTDGAGAFQAMLESTQRLAPVFMDMIDAIVGLLPTLLRFGTVAASVVLPQVTNLIQALDGVMEFVLGLSDQMRDLAIAAAVAAPPILYLASSIGALLGPLGVVAAAVTAFVSAYRTNFMGIQDLTNQALGPVMDSLRTLAGVFQDTMGEIIGAAQSIGNPLAGLLQSQAIQNLIGELRELGQIYITQVRANLEALLPIVQRVIGVFASNQGEIREFGQMAVQGITVVVEALQVLTQVAGHVVRNFLIPLLDTLTQVWAENFGEMLGEVIETVDAIVGYSQPLLKALAGFWQQYGDEILSTVSFVFDGLLVVVGTVLDALYTTILVALNLIQGDWGEAWLNIQDLVRDTTQRIMGFLRSWGIVRMVQNIVAGVVGWFQSLKTDAQGIIQGIQSAFQGIANYLTQTLPQQIKQGMLLAGAALLTVLFGVEGAKKIIRGLSTAWEAVQSTFDTVAGKIESTIQTLAEAISTAIQPVITLFTETIPQKLGDAIGWIQSKLDPLADWFTQTLIPNAILALGSLIGIFKSVSARIHNVFAGLWNSLVSMLVDAINQMLDVVVEGINQWLSNIDEVADTVQAVTGQSMPDLNQIQGVNVQAQRFQADRRSANQTVATQQAVQEIAAVLEFDIQGDGPLAEFVDQRAELRVRNNDKNNTRRKRRQNPNTA